MSRGFDPSWRDYVPAGAVPVKARSKYRAVPHTVLPDLRVLPTGECGAVAAAFTFDSKREADRFVVLMIDRKDGIVRDIEIQPLLPLHVISLTGLKVHIGYYRADFKYVRHGAMVYEDAKGVKTAVYSWKKKHAEAEYGIRILET